MDLELTGKVAVVTGASKGIGLAVVRELAGEGVNVVAGARNVESLTGIERVTPGVVDLADPEGPGQLVGSAVDRFGRIDLLVNVGSVHVRVDGFLNVTDADFEAALQLNFFAALRATRAAVTDMTKRGEGTIQELGPQGIRITRVSPGPVATDLWLGADGVADTLGRATGSGADAVRDQATSGMATGRFTTPEEVATIVALLASPRIVNVTGSNWVIDGGLIKTT